jgi:hypothetical protein
MRDCPQLSSTPSDEKAALVKEHINNHFKEINRAKAAAGTGKANASVGQAQAMASIAEMQSKLSAEISNLTGKCVAAVPQVAVKQVAVAEECVPGETTPTAVAVGAVTYAEEESSAEFHGSLDELLGVMAVASNNDSGHTEVRTSDVCSNGPEGEGCGVCAECEEQREEMYQHMNGLASPSSPVYEGTVRHDGIYMTGECDSVGNKHYHYFKECPETGGSADHVQWSQAIGAEPCSLCLRELDDPRSVWALFGDDQLAVGCVPSLKGERAFAIDMILAAADVNCAKLDVTLADCTETERVHVPRWEATLKASARTRTYSVETGRWEAVLRGGLQRATGSVWLGTSMMLMLIVSWLYLSATLLTGSTPLVYIGNLMVPCADQLSNSDLISLFAERVLPGSGHEIWVLRTILALLLGNLGVYCAMRCVSAVSEGLQGDRRMKLLKAQGNDNGRAPKHAPVQHRRGSKGLRYYVMGTLAVLAMMCMSGSNADRQSDVYHYRFESLGVMAPNKELGITDENTCMLDSGASRPLLNTLTCGPLLTFTDTL